MRLSAGATGQIDAGGRLGQLDRQDVPRRWPCAGSSNSGKFREPCTSRRRVNRGRTIHSDTSRIHGRTRRTSNRNETRVRRIVGAASHTSLACERGTSPAAKVPRRKAPSRSDDGERTLGRAWPRRRAPSPTPCQAPRLDFIGRFPVADCPRTERAVRGQVFKPPHPVARSTMPSERSAEVHAQERLLATSEASLAREKVAVISDALGRGGVETLANRGVVLSVASRTSASLIRLADGMGWPVVAE
jgi:hypothetical protein